MIDLLKLIINLLISVSAFIVFLYALEKPWERKLLRISVICGTLLKLAYSAVIFSLWPGLSRGSDMSQYTFPRMMRFLEGDLPCRDFPDPYSILYYPLLSIPARIWRSPGSLVLTVLLLESLMIFLYLRRSRDRESDGGWRTAFLYCFSPFSFYWVALSGHNGVMIAFWMMVALILAEKGRAWMSGIAGAAAFLTTKILGVLAWPAVVFFENRRWIIRAIPLVLSLVLTLSMLVFGFDVITPYKSQATNLTSGNIWFFTAVLFPAIRATRIWRILPVLAFAAGFIPLFILFLRRRWTRSDDRFTAASSLYAVICLLFLIVSKKTYNYYIIISLFFIVHSLTRGSHNLRRRVLTYSFICAVSYIEQYLWYNLNYNFNIFETLTGSSLYLLNLVMVGIYIYWITLFIRRDMLGRGETGHGGAPAGEASAAA